MNTKRGGSWAESVTLPPHQAQRRPHCCCCPPASSWLARRLELGGRTPTPLLGTLVRPLSRGSVALLPAAAAAVSDLVLSPPLNLLLDAALALPREWPSPRLDCSSRGERSGWQQYVSVCCRKEQE